MQPGINLKREGRFKGPQMMLLTGGGINQNKKKR